MEYGSIEILNSDFVISLDLFTIFRVTGAEAEIILSTAFEAIVQVQSSYVFAYAIGFYNLSGGFTRLRKRARYSNRLGTSSSKALRLCSTLLHITPSSAASL